MPIIYIFFNFPEYNFATQNMNEMLTTELRRHPEKCEVSHKYLTLCNKVFVINQKLWSWNAWCIFPYCLEITFEQSKIYVLATLIHFAHQRTGLTVMYGYTWNSVFWPRQVAYTGADKSLARLTSRCMLFDGENIPFDASLVIYM
jgi:hypothetical protein